MNIDAIIRAVQSSLGVESDGKAGPETWEAIYRKLVPAEQRPSPAHLFKLDAPVDERSERLIVTLLPEVQPYARALVNQAAAQGITIIVTSGLRSYAAQDALFAKHDGTTNARGGYSNHNFGLAFDVTIFAGKKPVWESPQYKAVGAMGIALGLTWGGNWKSIQDEPHFELRPKWAADLSEKDMLAQLRSRKASGTDLFA